MVERLGRWCYAHRWRVLVLWIVALVAFIALSNVAGGEYKADFNLPGTESQEVFDLLEERFPQGAGDQAVLVFKATDGVADPLVRRDMEALFADIAELPRVLSVASPYETPEGAAPQISPDGRIGFAAVQYEVPATEMKAEEVERLRDLGEAAQRARLQIEFGGPVIEFAEFEPPGGAELVGVLAAMIILLLTFGSVLAMGLPIMTALFGIGIGIALVLLSANVLSVPNFTTQLVSMIGIGVGIDYALFIVTRYRQGLSEGKEPEEAVAKSMSTSGRAVLFAGSVVVISFLGILLLRFSFIEGIAVGGAAAVLVTMLASLTLLPAVLGFVGRNIDRFHIPRLRRAEGAGRRSFWYRWSRLVQRRPWTALLIGLLIMGTLTVPLFRMRLGFADAGNNPESYTSRQAYDLLSEGFGPGFNGALVLVAELHGPEDLSVLQDLAAAAGETEGVAAVSPPIPTPEGDAALIRLFPTTAPQDQATNDLVRRLRGEVVPAVTEGTGVDVKVGGQTAAIVDFSRLIADRLPLLIAVVIALSFLLLMVVFRSLVVPAKAALMNLISIGAAYGVLVAVFQWGWDAGLIGAGKAGPIEAWLPMMLFTILFGLSMDYEIFLLSRVREEYVRTGNNNEAVANGVAATGRVITAAALIMVAVFLSFVFGFPLRQIKMFGLGLAVAVLVDATIVRMVLVPSAMELLGNANWWLPRWLKRILPKVRVEGAPEEPEREPAAV